VAPWELENKLVLNPSAGRNSDTHSRPGTGPTLKKPQPLSAAKGLSSVVEILRFAQNANSTGGDFERTLRSEPVPTRRHWSHQDCRTPPGATTRVSCGPAEWSDRLAAAIGCCPRFGVATPEETSWWCLFSPSTYRSLHELLNHHPHPFGKLRAGSNLPPSRGKGFSPH